MSWPPHLTVATVVHHDNRFLLVEERDQQLNAPVINQPAGHVEPGETLFAAALRETLEETGNEVELTGVVGVYYYYSPREDVTYHRLAFAARLVTATNRPLDPDILAVHWLTPEEIGSRRHRSPLVQQTFDDYRARGPLPLSFVRHPE